MAVTRVVSPSGIRNKAVEWRCADHDVEAVAVHPVQMVHIHVGDEARVDGRRLRVIKLEMSGAELIVFRRALPASVEAKEPDD
jgi:hypothetical protein